MFRQILAVGIAGLSLASFDVGATSAQMADVHVNSVQFVAPHSDGSIALANSGRNDRRLNGHYGRLAHGHGDNAYGDAVADAVIASLALGAMVAAANGN